MYSYVSVPQPFAQLKILEIYRNIITSWSDLTLKSYTATACKSYMHALPQSVLLTVVVRSTYSYLS